MRILEFVDPWFEEKGWYFSYQEWIDNYFKKQPNVQFKVSVGFFCIFDEGEIR